MTAITREGLERSFAFRSEQSASEGEGDGLTLSGYAAVFNQETEINTWEGHFIETIAPGAFKKTIRERTPVMQFDHGRHPLVGSIPIGSINALREDAEGLFVEARMADNWLMEPLRDAITSKSINGMSFRFEILREKWEDKDGKELKDPTEISDILWGWDPDERGPLKRTLKEVKVHELGPVVFPAYTGTSVDLRAREIANSVMSDEKAVRDIRSMLARNKRYTLTDGASDTPDTYRQVAAALLFRDAIKTKNEDYREQDKESIKALIESRIDEPSIEDTQTKSDDGAPLPEEHSSRPVNAELRSRMTYALRSMNRRLDSVHEELLGNAQEERNGA